MLILVGVALFLVYILISVITYHLFVWLEWHEAANSPLCAFWPVVIIFWAGLGLPVMFCIWLCEKMSNGVVYVKSAKTRQKIRPEIVK